jgi:hypothetical protein
MTIMRLTSVFLILIILSCRNVVKSREIVINQSVAMDIYKDKPVLLISCVKCGCFLDILSKPSDALVSTLSRYEILADSNCISKSKLPVQVGYISQTKIDNLFEDNYNLIVLSKRDNVFKSKLIETEGSPYLNKILSAF